MQQDGPQGTPLYNSKYKHINNDQESKKGIMSCSLQETRENNGRYFILRMIKKKIQQELQKTKNAQKV